MRIRRRWITLLGWFVIIPVFVVYLGLILTIFIAASIWGVKNPQQRIDDLGPTVLFIAYLISWIIKRHMEILDKRPLRERHPMPK